MALATIFAGLGAAKSVADYIHGRRNRTPKFGSTAIGKELQRQSEEGVYSPAIRRGILGNVSRRAGNIASQNRARIRGGLIRSGMDSSIAGQRLLSSPDRETQRTIAGATRDINTQNALSRVRAREEYARGVTGNRLQRLNENRKDFSSLTGGLMNAANLGYNIHQNERNYDLQKKELDIRDAYYNSRNTDDFFRLSNIDPADFVKMSEAEIADIARLSGLSIEQIQRLRLDAWRRAQNGGGPPDGATPGGSIQ